MKCTAKATVPVAVLLIALRGVHAQQYPPPGFEAVESQESPHGGFKLVEYKKDPKDFSSESQIWLEPIKPEYKRQLLFTHHNRSYWRMDEDDSHIAIGHHADSNDNFVWVYVRGRDGQFRQIRKELRDAALKIMSAKLEVQKAPGDFDHFDCYADVWLRHGLLLPYLRGDSPDRDFYLNPWYFVYDADHDRFTWDISAANKDSLIQRKK